jgi:hypothetical protein
LGTPASIADRSEWAEDSVLLQRVIYAAFFLESGCLLLLLPWTPFWEHNYFGAVSSALHLVMTNDFVRGAVSGLGLLNLSAGITELLPLFRSK